ncbi:MAG: response regulator [Gemmatimonadetes bacterium]|nr:response regulator [Gemmatimonadota bacterium]
MRLAAVRRTLPLLDASTEKAFDWLTGLASLMLHVPVSLVTFVEEDRLVLKSCMGMPEPWASEREMPLSYSLCPEVVAHREPLVIGDTRRHPAGERSEVRRLCVTAYAGVPLVTSDGHVLGAFCAIDSNPREWSAAEINVLKELAASAVTEIDLRVAVWEAEREHRDKLAILESITDAFFALDKEWRFTYLNREAGRLLEQLGRTREELIGRNVWVEFQVRPDTKGGQQLRRAASEQVTVEFEAYYEPLDRWFALHAYPSKDGLSVFCRDITERRKAEEDRERLTDELRQAQKMEAVGRLAGGVAHDFNNVLTVIQGHTNLLLEDLPPANPIRAELEEIRRSAERAAELTRQLLAFSRRQVLQPRVVNLNAVISEMEKMLRRLIGEDIDITTDLERSLGTTKADPGQLQQVVMNLVVNARDAMPGGGRLTIRTSNVELSDDDLRRLPYVQSGPYVLLQVSDTGLGMDKETQSRIFEPFFTTKEQGKGTGLGLATVYGIVKQSGGYIWVTSEPGQGSTFNIYLPRMADEVEKVAGADGGRFVPRGSETILLVEDEDPVRALVRKVLLRNGYRVLEAGNAADALGICDEYGGPVHLLVTDIIMPEMNGQELARRVALLRPGTRVLYMSGYTDSEVLDRGGVDPGTVFLQKPFTPEALAQTIREVLDAATPV